MIVESTYIAGAKTVDDWRILRTQLVAANGRECWRAAFDDFYRSRIESRYFKPIRSIQNFRKWEGEGFSILTIQCAMIEFLEATVQGKKYRHLGKGANRKLGADEYSRSEDMFVSFLCLREPFKKEFNKALAKEFYQDIRCGLVHEARTKNGWKVRASNESNILVDSKNRIVYRDSIQHGLESFISWYGDALQADSSLQQAFVRKFDHLCE